MMGGWMWFWWIFWLAIIILVVWLIFSADRNKTGQVSEERPLDILKKRYARGEISREEFKRMKEDLQG